ncbi:MAG: hypothetical protein WD738_11085 [Pirellulales bacterium]
MFRKRMWQFCAAVLGVTTVAGVATAQSPSPGSPFQSSPSGGYGSSQMSSIYRQAVGSGYSGSSLNQIALRNAQAQVPNVGQMSTRSGPGSYGLGSSMTGKPFSGYSAAPTVSPYLNLFREDFDGNSDFNYQTLVRPLQQQQQFNQMMERQSMEVAKRLQTIAAQADFNPQGSTSQYPTGHRTVFMNYSHFYPVPAGQRR